MRLFYANFTNFIKISQHHRMPILKMVGEENECDARKIFSAAVESVLPENLINNAVQVHSNIVEIQGKKFPISKNVHIVGFGKAVLGMARALEVKLKNQIVSGILSVPEGSLGSSHDNNFHNSCIKVYEGAFNNIPDEKSYNAACKITELVTSLSKSDLLFVLISGGGSALLPSPKPPLTLTEKLKTIQLLASKGASIEELNAVRKKLSTLKGGGLAKLAHPTKIVSLILSDIIGDPLSFIASGPTVENKDDLLLPLTIIEKYHLKSEISKTVLKLIQSDTENKLESDESFSHVSNFIIGNNKLALEAASLAAKNLNYLPYILTDGLIGKAREVGTNLISFIVAAIENDTQSVIQFANELKFNNKSLKGLSDSVSQLDSKNKRVCVLLGGETTVEVQGKGCGGRNQEIALSSAIVLKTKKVHRTITLLSAGTDGIDGPTDAAGAIATKFIIDAAETESLDAVQFLNNNDSYNFYDKLCSGLYHVKTGHTGTNVMDIIIILIK